MPTLERWTPLRELDRMERRLRRVFEDVGFFPALAPATDIYETEKDYVLEIEVAGFELEELEVEVTDHSLVVTGKRAHEVEREEETVLLHERLEREFERRFRLPSDTDTEHVEARFEKGILELHVPKTIGGAAHKVEITA